MANARTDPVLLCNDLGARPSHQSSQVRHDSDLEHFPVDSTMSIKEAVRVATTNNFMGITCRANILSSVPALIEAIKEAGLVLVSDASLVSNQAVEQTASPATLGALEGIDGVLRSNGTLHFQQRLEV